MKIEERYPNKFISKSNIQFAALLVALLSLNNAWNLKTIVGVQIETTWNEILDRTGDDIFNLYVYGINIWTLTIYWTIGLLFLLIELLAWPKCIVRRKIQPKVVMDMKDLPSLIRVNLFNQFFLMVPCSVIGYHLLNYIGTAPPVRELPTLFRFMSDLVIMIPVQEIFTYYTHRMFHHRLLYKWTHKWHHEWTAPVALSAMYNHPLDQLFVNFLPVTMGLALTNPHLFTQWLWLTWNTLISLNDHSGYRLFAFPSPVRHDFHHEKFTECFGGWNLGPLDYLHGTDKVFRAKMAREMEKRLNF